MIKHKNFAKRRPDVSNLHKMMNDLGAEYFNIELMEHYPCESQEELQKRGGEMIKQLGALNQKAVGRSNEEKKQLQKDYARDNKDKRNQQRNERRKENPEKTREEYKKYGAQYRERHPEKIKAWQTTKVECECGGKYTLSHKAEDLNSKKRLKYFGTCNKEEYKQSKRAMHNMKSIKTNRMKKK